MAFTAQEIQNSMNAALDWYVRGAAFSSTIQAKPLLEALTANQKTFPGGKTNISIPVKGDYTSQIQGYFHNDTVTYANPANIKRAVFPWKEIHSGIGVTFTELKQQGIHVTDSAFGKNTTQSSDSELITLTNLLQDKLEDLGEGWARTFDTMCWLDGTQDSKQVPGIRSLIVDSPTTGITGGIDRSISTWWQNQSFVGSNKITSSPTNQTLSIGLRSLKRQLRRYAPNPKFKNLCGSTFLNLLGAEIQAKGYYTLEGFTKTGANDVGMEEYSLKGLGTFEYCPALDDLGFPDRCYIIDMNAIKLQPMEGEDKKTHNPARPYNQYSLYRAMTWTGGLTANQLNSSAVVQTA